MKLFSVLAGIVGLTLIGALVAHFGVGAVTRSLVSFGWKKFPGYMRRSNIFTCKSA